MKRLLYAALLCVATLAARADEGMWMLNKIDPRTAEVMKDLGLKLSPKELYNPEGLSLKDAVVDFGDFCSGVVVSPEGLVFTNHHCGYGAIQKLSSPTDDILANGFVARTKAEERPAEGLFVRFLERTEDVTSRVMQAMNGLPNEKLDSVLQAVEREWQEANPDRYCTVKGYFTQNAYYVSLYKTYTDVRLVFTPTETLGKFGGDTDNWMWPRQTCDFSVFRVYARPDGTPAGYSADNVPLKVERYARISLDGYQPGDYCMTIGFPGSTDRYLSSFGVSERVNASNVAVIDVRGKKQEVWKRFMDSDRAIAIQYASKWANSSNYWKNSIGMNKAVADLNVIGLKQYLERQIRDWYSQDEGLTNRFGTMLTDLEQGYRERFQPMRSLVFFTETFVRGIELRTPAALLAALPAQPDSVTVARTRERLAAFYKDYNGRVDEAVMAALLENYRKQVPAEALPACYALIDSAFGGDYAAYARDVYGRTVLTAPDCLDRVLADSTLLDTDLGFRYAAGLTRMRTLLAARMREAGKTLEYNEHLLTQAILERDQETPHYSDANFTMRLSYGYVQDYTAQGTRYDYYTNSRSLLDKAARQGENEDYKLEGGIVSLIKRGDFGRYADKRTGEMHLCFLSNNDITGGNSGSPMFNGRGELIGLAFDGNWEAMSGDISFNADLQRCIGVDIRFVLYLMEKWGGAGHLIQEMGL